MSCGKEIFGYKHSTMVTQEIWQITSWIYRLWGNKIGDYVCEYIIDDIMTAEGRLRHYSCKMHKLMMKVKKKLNFRVCPISTISSLASRYVMSNMRCFLIGGMKKKTTFCYFGVIWHDWGNHLFTHSLTVNNSLSSLLFYSRNLELTCSLCSSQPSKLF